MGTDIHAFVEFDDSDEKPFCRNGIQSISAGSLVLERNYEIFDALAWGRSSQLELEHRAPPPVVQPRGIPEILSKPAAWTYYSIVATADRPDPRFWPPEAVVDLSTADDWEREGSGRSKIEQTGHYGMSPPQTWDLIARPCWHTATWLTPEEVVRALARCEGLPLTYHVLKAILAACVAQVGPHRVRLVLWFDH